MKLLSHIFVMEASIP